MKTVPRNSRGSRIGGMVMKFHIQEMSDSDET